MRDAEREGRGDAEQVTGEIFPSPHLPYLRASPSPTLPSLQPSEFSSETALFPPQLLPPGIYWCCQRFRCCRELGSNVVDVPAC